MPSPDPSTLLEPGETVLWSGRPRPYVFILRGLPNLAYGVTWAVLGAFWFRGAGGIGRYSAFEGWWRLTPLFAFPFILAGLSFFFYPLRLGPRARRTWYFITNRRVFIAELFLDKPPKLRVFQPGEIAAMHITQRIGKLYDITLSPGALANPHLTPRLEEGFFGIENGGQALDALLQLTGKDRPAIVR